VIEGCAGFIVVSLEVHSSIFGVVSLEIRKLGLVFNSWIRNPTFAPHEAVYTRCEQL